jgi:hypothetical protein
MRCLKKVYFRALELLGGSEEILLFWTPCDEIKHTFLALIRHCFVLKKLDVPTLCPISLVRLGLETCARRLLLHTGP